LIAELLRETKERKLWLLHGVGLELSAQVAIFSSDWADASTRLNEAERHLRNFGGVEELFIKKWRTLLLLKQKGPSKNRLQALAEVREEALQKKHGETVRDCDLFKAVSTQSLSLFHHLYFGTRFDSFKKRIREEAKEALGSEIKIPRNYCWQDLEGHSKLLDLTVPKNPLKNGMLLHRALVTLSSDFYQPFSMGSLHAELFPECNYHPLTSSTKIYQLIKRVRIFLKQNHPDLQIASTDGRYTLWPSSTTAIKKSLHTTPTLSIARLDQLENSFERSENGKSLFTSIEAAEALQLSDRTTERLLQVGVDTNRILRLGRGPKTHYQFVSLETHG